MNTLYSEPDYTKLIEKNSPLTVLAEGQHKGFNYIIIDNTFCPCAYVEIPDGSLLCGYEWDSPLLESVSKSAHGGLSYSDNSLHELTLDRTPQIVDLHNWFIGWDYNHIGDKRRTSTGLPTHALLEEHAYTTPEIMLDCQNVCESLAKIYDVPNESDLLYKKELGVDSIIKQIDFWQPILLKQLFDIGASEIHMSPDDQLNKVLKLGHITDHKYPVPIDLLGIPCRVVFLGSDCQHHTVLDAVCANEYFQRLEDYYATKS